jgi:hypothetical protein
MRPWHGYVDIFGEHYDDIEIIVSRLYAFKARLDLFYCEDKVSSDQVSGPAVAWEQEFDPTLKRAAKGRKNGAEAPFDLQVPVNQPLAVKL